MFNYVLNYCQGAVVECEPVSNLISLDRRSLAIRFVTRVWRRSTCVGLIRIGLFDIDLEIKLAISTGY